MSRGWRRTVCLLLLTLLSPLASAQLVESFDVVRTISHIDIVMLLRCPARYLSHDAADAADTLRIRLEVATECGSADALRGQTLDVTGFSDLLRSLDVAPSLGSEVAVEVRWQRAERAVVLPTADRTELRMRLLRPGREAATSQVVISEPAGELTTPLAINLDSSREPFAADIVSNAARQLGWPAYVSTFKLEDTQWYRLRVGPIPTRADAERALLAAQRAYPRAWLAIADEVVIESSAPPPSAAAVEPATEPVSATAADEALLDTARTRLRQKRFDEAIELLTKYLSATGRKRAEARELLGLARERNGQLAHAKAEYEAFLRAYPTHASAPRVRRRLAALRTAQLAGRGPGAQLVDDELGWRSFGSLAQTYRRDTNRIDTQRVRNEFVGQHALLSDIEGLVRRRGFDFDVAARFSGGYAKDLLADGPGDRIRVTSAFVEVVGRDAGWSTRIGRQARSAGGVLGTFDGAYANYQWRPHLTLDAALGFPVESTRAAPVTSRPFEAVALGFGVFDDAWEPGLYLVNQTYDGVVDRQAVGAELRYFRPGRSVVGFADYDIHFATLNSAVVIGALQLPARWMLNIDLERRNSPLLTTRNSLIGQSVESLDALRELFDDAEIRQLAADRTSRMEIYGATLSRPFGERFQLSMNAASLATGATEPSGGVEGIPATGRELVVSLQWMAASVMRAGDLTAIGIRRQQGGPFETSSLGLSSRVPLWGDWRLQPLVRVDRRTFELDAATQWIYVSAWRLSLQKPRLLFELEVGGELASRTAAAVDEDIKRFFLSLGYRWSF